MSLVGRVREREQRGQEKEERERGGTKWRENIEKETRERETNRGLKVEGCLGRSVRHASGRHYDDLEHVFAMERSLVHLLSDLDPLHRVALHVLMSRTDTRLRFPDVLRLSSDKMLHTQTTILVVSHW